MLTRFLPFIAAMSFVVVLSNYLVQFPVDFQLGSLALADLLTWGAFTYPLAFLVTDLTNRHFGVGAARFVVVVGFVVAVVLSVWLASPRIAIASGTAFLLAQMLDITIFNRLRASAWWQAPLVSSVLGSILDTALFFSLAFASQFGMLGTVESFVSEASPLLGVMDMSAPRWVSWALGDFGVKILVALAMLLPYGLATRLVRDRVLHPAG